MDKVSILTVYSVNPMVHFHHLDDLARKTAGILVLASSDSALYFDDIMISVTYSTTLSMEEFEAILQTSSPASEYHVCEEDDWFCDK